jgi:hypothetical protein
MFRIFLIGLCLLLFTWPALASDTALNDLRADARSCFESQIATGQYFLISPATGDIAYKQAGMRLFVACEKKATAWINLCERMNGRDSKCTEWMYLFPQKLLQNAA